MCVYCFIYFFAHALGHAGSSQPGMEPVPAAVGGQSLSHWITWEVHVYCFQTYIKYVIHMTHSR